MTQKQFWSLALVCNVIFLFLYIFKQNAFITIKHAVQKEEQKLADLQQQKKVLFNRLQKLQQQTTIKKRAEQELGMRKTNFKQISPLAQTAEKAA